MENKEQDSKPPKVFYCKSCNKNDTETKFYEYLTSRCISCKIKKVKEIQTSKVKEKREEKISEIDPDERIRYLWSEMMKEPFYRNGRKSLLEFMEETDQDISQLVMEDENIKVDCFKAIDALQSKVDSLLRFKKDIDDLINMKVKIAIDKILSERNEF